MRRAVTEPLLPRSRKVKILATLGPASEDPDLAAARLDRFGHAALHSRSQQRFNRLEGRAWLA